MCDNTHTHTHSTATHTIDTCSKRGLDTMRPRSTWMADTIPHCSRVDEPSLMAPISCNPTTNSAMCCCLGVVDVLQ